MANSAKKFSPAIFGITLISFLLPFITVSCDKQPIVTLTGLQLSTGTTIEQRNFKTGKTEQQKIPPELMTVLALISAAVGLGTSFLKAKKSAIVPAGSGIVGFILLLLLKSKTDNDILKQGQGLLQVQYGAGFWLAFLLFLSAAILNTWVLLQKEKAEEEDTYK